MTKILGVSLLAALMGAPAVLEAGQAAPSAAASSYAGFSYAGPPPPVPPQTITRDGDGRITVRAVRITDPLRVDGTLDEEIYRTLPPMSDFVQIEPNDLQPATEQTEVWLLYDDDNVYVSIRCIDSDMAHLVANEMRRDSGQIFQGNDLVAFMFDPFYDRRNNVTFVMTPLAGRMDGQSINEQQYLGDWNPVWDLKTRRYEDSWTVETAIPFKSLRYQPGRVQLWSFNVLRAKRSKNEISLLSHVSKARGMQGLRQVSSSATVVGLEVPAGARNLDVKPFVVSDLTTNLTASPTIRNDPSGDGGLDVKYGITQNLTADFTWRTDFAQAEADEQQVNLTRFSLFFPEKRDFFLENQGTFAFGGSTATGAGGDAPTMFYSRRIGLKGNREVPVVAGGRLTGRVGKFNVGALNIQTAEDEDSASKSTNFSVLRVKRDFLRKSSLGLMFTDRSVRQNGTGRNQLYGFDGLFGFYQNFQINTYWAKTVTDRLDGDDTSYRVQVDYPGDRYGVQAERLMIGDNFNPEVGFVRRDNMVRSFGLFRFSPRPRASRTIRRYSYIGSLEYIEDGTGRLETREGTGEFALEFQNADRFSVTYTNIYDFLPTPFEITTGIRLPVAGYDYQNGRVAFNMGQQRRVSFNLFAEHGTFYSGHKTSVGASRGRLNLNSQISVEPTYTVNRVELEEGSFTTHLAGSRIIYTVTPLMFATALVQYNSDSRAVTANVRLRWEYRPGSELFVVFNEERTTRETRLARLSNRSLIVKINRLFRF
jgi:hypothetical protein